ncbi:unnamed protein product [Rangifer tarandus platyrhynchus]|uniref:Uncharacterized protein n=1 Tax=Rangifer tarandus platyrhynchus TaxID=3082113 RepID=A0AC59YHN2_RANTA
MNRLRWPGPALPQRHPRAEPQDGPHQRPGEPSAADGLTQVLPAEPVQPATGSSSRPQTLTAAGEPKRSQRHRHLRTEP